MGDAKLSRRTRFVLRQKPCVELPDVASISIRLPWDTGMDELMRSIESYVIAVGFTQKQLDDYIVEWAEEIRESQPAQPRSEES